MGMKKIIIMDHVLQQAGLKLDRENENARIINAYSNEGILILHQKERADLIITELYGGMKARPLCATIRQDPSLRNVSIVICCRNNEIELAESRQCKANVIITLPVESKFLNRIIREFANIPERVGCRVPFFARSAKMSAAGPFECAVENISVSGMLIEAAAPLTPGDRLMCSLNLSPGELVQMQAEVIRTAATSADRKRYGLRFTQIDRRALHAIQAVVDARLAG